MAPRQHPKSTVYMMVLYVLVLYVLWVWENAWWHVANIKGSSRVFLLPSKSTYPPLPLPLPLATTDLFTVSIAFPFPECHRVGITIGTGFPHLVIGIQGFSMPFMIWCSFLFRTEKYPIIWMHHNLFSHPPTDTHLGGLPVSSTMNKATINICTQVSMWIQISNSGGLYQEVGWLDCVWVCLAVQETADHLLKCLWQSAPQPCMGVPVTLYPRQFESVTALDFGHSSGCAVAPHCFFNLKFPSYLWCWTSFHKLRC
jgi:hypothetical protein